ncbi:unnamed protein product [Cryptosporidium hominis]|uniref:Uncharacterized protein n=2 Tax=Cryptosporidium hominis TaxID=237895 RepID=A0A0S4TDS5_CRYHO|nr:hypothetical protein ChTU502y2012_413g0065 [Cryptosporidium hominis]PPA65489.1 hypothetical protein ChUKH1_01140 [Cryptosporidium hominis]CUV05518.1 unnamed protein product [Cryptosporidium hominis]
MNKASDYNTKEECQDLTKVKKEKSTKSGILKHVLLGSIIAVIFGYLSKYYFFDKIVLTEENLPNISSINQNEVNIGNEEKTLTKGTFGEEEYMELLQDDKTITLEQISQDDSLEDNDELMFNHEDEALYDQIEDDYRDDEAEDESEDGENESQIDSETLKRMLKEDVQLELDEGFAAKDFENEESIDVIDDAEIDEYEHETDDDITDNNWSDDETELKKMENQKEQEQEQKQEKQ